MVETLVWVLSVSKPSEFSDLFSSRVMIFERDNRREDSLNTKAAGRVGHSVKVYIFCYLQRNIQIHYAAPTIEGQKSVPNFCHDDAQLDQRYNQVIRKVFLAVSSPIFF